MKSRNLIRSFEERLLHPEEERLLSLGADRLLAWMDGEKPSFFPELPRTISSLYLFAAESETSASSVRDLCRFFRREIPGEDLQENIRPFLDGLWFDLQEKRIAGLLEKINDKTSLSPSDDPAAYVSQLDDPRLEGLYENKLDGQNIDFFVQKLPFPLEVLDPRIVRIPPGKTNELHRHAHETVFVYLQGSGHARVDEVKIPVKAGDFVFIPRWCRHQSVNEGAEEMIFLAVADFGLTGKSYFGNYLKTARLKEGK